MTTARRLFGVAITAILVLSLSLVGCGNGNRDKVPQGVDDAPKKHYEIKGEVVAIDPDGKAVTLDHEDIPGLMKAMEMEFAIEDPAILRDVEAGDRVQGRLITKDGSYIITELKKSEP